jgi:hypothetical protein
VVKQRNVFKGCMGGFDMTKNKLYDALVIPTGETSFGDRESFPVTNEAIKAFNSGKYGCIFVTGGYNGFATAERKKDITEAQETAEYLLKKDIPLEKIYFDGRSLDSVGNFTFPIVCPTHGNPSLMDFDNMEIFAKEGHIWRIMDYSKLVMQDKNFEGKIGFYSLPGEHNNGLIAKVYHKGIMNALKGKHGAEEIHDFLMKEHPFYSKGWYDKFSTQRKVEMALTGVGWIIH